MNRSLTNIIFFAAYVITAALGCPAAYSLPSEIEDSGARADSAFYKLEAGHLKFREENGNQVIYLSDTVRIYHQTATITSMKGKYYVDEERFVLRNEVHAVDSTMEIFGDVGEYFRTEKTLFIKENVRCRDVGMEILCERARYDREKNEALLTGDVQLSDSTRVLYADTVYYDRVTETADAYGNVVLVNLVEDYAIAGAHACYQRGKQKVVMNTGPVLTFDQSQKFPGRIKAGQMQFNLDKNVGMAVGNVELIKGETRATCDSAVIFNDEGYVELLGEPEASSGLSSMYGSSIELWYDKREVNRIVLPGKGRLTEAPPGGSHWWKDSWIEGDSVIIHLAKENVDSVKIFGNAKAMYYPIESEKNKVSNNYSTGDSMFFKFKYGDLTYVRVSGNANGLYKYLHINDSETIDSLAAKMDTILKYRDFNAESRKIKYGGVNIEYFADTEELSLDNKASLFYENNTLTADHIDFNSKMNILKAEGTPVLEESDQEMYGYEMGYDMGGGGIVVDGSTQYNKGYYRGKHIFKDGDDILKVYDSIYTTCELKKPHYSLRANKMKVYIGDKVVSGPIKLYIGEIPVFYLPFMANSIRRDRHSGILKPNFDIGMNSRDGRFIRGLGYYWATNDYTDFTVKTDFNEFQNFRIQLDNRYKIRYMLDGNVRLNFMRDFQNKASEWTVNSSHSQTFGKSASFRSNLRFVSSDQAQSALHRAEDVKNIVDRRIYSSASFNKSWGGTRFGLSASRNQKLNVDNPYTNRISGTMPSLTLNFPRISLWFGTKHNDTKRSILERMLRSVAFSPNLSAKRATEESEAKKSTSISANSGVSLSQQHKLLFLNLSPSVSMRWNYSDISYSNIDTSLVDPNSFIDKTKSEFSMSLNSGIGTTLYGTFYPKMGSIRGIRHTFNPSVTYSYTPKLGEGQVERRNVRYSVRNILDLKVLENEKLVKKNNMITWNLGGSYNPDAAEDNRFSNISSNVRTSIGNIISLSLNQSIDPKEKEIVSTSFSTDLSLGGSFSYPGKWKVLKAEKIAAAGSDSVGSADEEDHSKGSAKDQQKWSFNMGYSYSSRNTSYAGKSISSRVNFRGNIKLTKGWQVSYSGYYDLERQEFTNQEYSLKRDLHCWQASFIHREFGGERSYYFQISIKELPDIMYERGKRGLKSSVPFM